MNKKELSLLLMVLPAVILCSCTSSGNIKTSNLNIELSAEGKITEIQIGENKIAKNIMSFTEIEGCRVVGKVKVHKLSKGARAFERKMVNDSLHTSCTVTDRFTATKNSIRWDVEIKGDDSGWSAPIKTVFNYPATNESRFWTTWGRPKLGSSTGNDLKEQLKPVKGGSNDISLVQKSNSDWVDPLIPVPFINDTLYYGAPLPYSYDRSLVSAEWTFFRELFSVPVFSVLEKNDDVGISLALSPEDNILGLVMTVNSNGSITFSRLFNKISKENIVKFSMDIIGDAGDWRCGLGWMATRYPEYFDPKNPGALKLNGTSAYSNSYKDFDIEKMKNMAFTVNWQASFDFPYMGMFLPPVAPGIKWKRFGGGEMSIAEMNDYAGSMKSKGFYILNYFNVTEFGTRIQYPYTPKKLSDDPGLWKDCNEFLFSKLPGAILRYKDKYDSSTKNGSPFHTWGNALVMDCADPAYREFLLEQARRHVNEIPNSFGICIDRLDWLNIFNIDADDGISWIDGKPARSIGLSYKSLMEKLGPIMHDNGKYILANNIGRRLDYFKHLDGMFDEFSFAGTPINNTAFICINKPALGWTDNKETVLKSGGDAFFQKYLYMGVYPMCPYPGNDHSIQPSDTVDAYYLQYGPLMKLMQQRKWILSANPVSVKNDAAKANIFSVPEGYLIPVVYGKEKKVQLSIRPPAIFDNMKCLVYYPGSNAPLELDFQENGDLIIINVDLNRGCGMVVLKKI